MIAELSAGIGSAKALVDLAKGLHAAATQAQVNDVKIALQEHVLNIQAALSAAQAAESASADRIHELEQEIVRLKDWEGEKQRYELKALTAGVFAYALKEGMERGEPPHLICANCYQHGQKAILQRGMGAYRAPLERCSACKTDLDVTPRAG